MSPISSRNRVPPRAALTRPSRRARAPVKAPFSCPNSSLSNRLSVSPEHSTGTKAPSRRALPSWMARATSSLPVPDSPSNSAAVSLGATRWISASIALKADERPTMPAACGDTLAPRVGRSNSTKYCRAPAPS